MTIDTSREAVERLLDDVTPGPWSWAENHPTNACANVTAEAISGWTIDIATLYGCSDGVPNPSEPDEPWGDHPIRRANARFIAASRELVPAILAERDAALAEVARLSTPPDDAEVEAAHREWFATTYPHTYADVQSDYEALDAFVTSGEAWAAATLAIYAARRKEQRK